MGRYNSKSGTKKNDVKSSSVCYHPAITSKSPLSLNLTKEKF